jgi:hypothetical protein
MLENFQPSLVKIGKKTKRVSLQRYLTTKIVIEPERVSEADMVCLFENQLWLERKCLQDRNFFRKYSDSVYTLSFFLKEADLRRFNLPILVQFSKRIKPSLIDFLVPARHYPQWKSRFCGRFSFNPNILDKGLSAYFLSKKLPPKRSMGTGYRDKGSRRNLAKDGSPDWREVASALSSAEWWEKEIDDATDLKDIERVLFRVFPDVDWSSYVVGKNTAVSADNPETVKREKAAGEG